MKCHSSDNLLTVYVEWPTFFDSGVGHAVARRGDLGKLTFGAGYICGALGECFGCQTVPVTVNEWKGQLPKAVVTERIKHLLGKNKCQRLGITSHAWDAVGIGLYAKGCF